MRKLSIFAAILFCAFTSQAQILGGASAVGGNGSLGGGVTAGGGTIALKHQGAIDPGAGSTTGIQDPWAATVNAAGDLIVIKVATSGGGQVTSVCDSTTNATCTVSASTYTIGTTTCSAGNVACVTFAWTCNAAASVRFFTIPITGGPVDMSVTYKDYTHTVTSNCLDAAPTPTITSSAGSTITSASITTSVANEVVDCQFADDNNSGPGWTGTAGGTLTLDTKASAANSMLGGGEYQIFTTIQTGITPVLNTGNSSGHSVTFGCRTFE